jgi:Xaa-Pro aminopeptidase
MNRDLDAILQANDIDALLVTGPGQHNPAMVYLTGGGHLTNADVILRRGAPAVLFHAAMERDEAAKTGLATRSYNLYPARQLLSEVGGDRVKAAALRYVKMLADAGVTAGRVAVFGRAELSASLPVLRELERMLPGIELVGDPEGKILSAATLTKDESEVERIRKMGQITVEVVGRTADYLTTRAVEDEVLVDGGKPLTIGRMKGLINLWLAELGAENPEGTIFAIGSDAGVPHSSGKAEDVLRLGRTIVFDIFPCEAGGGYYHDFTRTWCLGYAPDEVHKVYQDVLATFTTVAGEMKAGVHFGEYQKRTAEIFEEMGHPTVLSNPEIEEGYVHSLGHGVGLRIHERPFSGAGASPEDVLQPGVVATLEPGLYYPKRGFGVRLENTFYVCPDGTIETLVDYPLDLVLPMRG